MDSGKIFPKRFALAFILGILSGGRAAETYASDIKPVHRQSVRLSYDAELAKKGFPSPLVEARIHGKIGRFILDTGASIHIIDSHFAQLADLRSEQSGESVHSEDSVGSKQAAALSHTTIDVMNVVMGTISLKNQSIVVIDLPKEFHDSDLAGILSPQEFLSDGEGLLLDLTIPSLELDLFETLENAPNAKKFEPLKVALPSVGNKESSVRYMINGFADRISTIWEIDTGADGATLGVETQAGRSLLNKAKDTGKKAMGVNGKISPTMIAPSVAIQFLGKVMQEDVSIEPVPRMMGGAGMLGMRELRDCTLLLGLKKASMGCR